METTPAYKQMVEAQMDRDIRQVVDSFSVPVSQAKTYEKGLSINDFDNYRGVICKLQQRRCSTK